MQYNQIPAKFPIPFANAAGSGYIRAVPAASQIGVNAGAASLTDGFPPVCFSPVGSGGIPPAGVDFNGILNQITAWTRWQAAGAIPQYDAAFSSAIGGYPQGSVLASATAGTLWLSTVDNNTSNPDGTSPTGWIGLFTGSGSSLAPANVPFGKKLVTNTTRRVLTGNQAAVQQIAWDPFAFTKQRSDTNLLIVGQFYNYTTSANGASYICFNFLNTGTSTTTTVKQVAVAGVSGNAALNVFNKTISGLAAGSYLISIGLEREDTTSWTTVFLPNSSDIAGTISPSVGELQVEEVKSAT